MPSLIPFEIDDTSALSLHKKQSSTYSKYACGCFLCAPSIAERTRMSVVISSSEICVVHKSRR